MRAILVGCLAVVALGATAGTAQTDVELDLGDGFVAAARLSLPDAGPGPFPTLILFHGSGPSDMNATVSGAPGRPPISANFRLIADRLAKRGVATLRFNKRGVRADGTPDWDQIGRSTLLRLIEDAHAVVDAAARLEGVDSDAVFLYGWDQGAQVVAHAAAARADIAGVILQGAPAGGWADIFRHEHVDVGLPHLADVVDADGDGLLSLIEMDALPQAPVTPVGLMPAFYLWSSESTPSYPRLRADVDLNEDGFVDIDAELRPLIRRQLAGPSPNPFVRPEAEPTRLIPAVMADTDVPALVLQGDADGWVGPFAGDRIANTARERIGYRRYVGLGHALDPTSEPALDSFGVMAPEPIADMAEWIAETIRRRDALPRVEIADAAPALALPDVMTHALATALPGFRSWQVTDYEPAMRRRRWYTRWHAPFAAIGDYNGDGVLDVVLMGTTDEDAMTVCVMSAGGAFTTLELARRAFGSKPVRPAPGVVLSAFARGYVRSGHEDAPLDLRADAFVVNLLEKSAVVRYYEAGEFHQYAISD